jgi:hypothetical protein
MTPFPAIGSRWSAPGSRTVEVIRYDKEKRRVRIHFVDTDTLTWAKAERFNGKSKGYVQLQK